MYYGGRGPPPPHFHPGNPGAPYYGGYGPPGYPQDPRQYRGPHPMGVYPQGPHPTYAQQEYYGQNPSFSAPQVSEGPRPHINPKFIEKSESTKILRNPYPPAQDQGSKDEMYDPSSPTITGSNSASGPNYPVQEIDYARPAYQQKQHNQSGEIQMVPNPMQTQSSQLQSSQATPHIPTEKINHSTSNFSEARSSDISDAPIIKTMTGVVTQIQAGGFGMISEEIFFQQSSVSGSMPKVGDKVVVEAEAVVGMPFKYNAKRVTKLDMDLVHENKSLSNNANSTAINNPEMQALPSMPETLGLTRPSSSTSPKLRSILKRNPPPPPIISKNGSRAVASSTASLSSITNTKPPSRPTTFSVDLDRPNPRVAPPIGGRPVDFTEYTYVKSPQFQDRPGMPPIHASEDSPQMGRMLRPESPLHRGRQSPTIQEFLDMCNRTRESDILSGRNRSRSRSPVPIMKLGRNPSRSPPSKKSRRSRSRSYSPKRRNRSRSPSPKRRPRSPERRNRSPPHSRDRRRSSPKSRSRSRERRRSPSPSPRKYRRRSRSLSRDRRTSRSPSPRKYHRRSRSSSRDRKKSRSKSPKRDRHRSRERRSDPRDSRRRSSSSIRSFPSNSPKRPSVQVHNETMTHGIVVKKVVSDLFPKMINQHEKEETKRIEQSSAKSMPVPIKFQISNSANLKPSASASLPLDSGSGTSSNYFKGMLNITKTVVNPEACKIQQKESIEAKNKKRKEQEPAFRIVDEEDKPVLRNPGQRSGSITNETLKRWEQERQDLKKGSKDLSNSTTSQKGLLLQNPVSVQQLKQTIQNDLKELRQQGENDTGKTLRINPVNIQQLKQTVQRDLSEFQTKTGNKVKSDSDPDSNSTLNVQKIQESVEEGLKRLRSKFDEQTGKESERVSDSKSSSRTTEPRNSDGRNNQPIDSRESSRKEKTPPKRNSTSRPESDDEEIPPFDEEMERLQEDIHRQRFVEEEQRLRSIGDDAGLQQLYYMEDRRRRRHDERHLLRLRLTETQLKKDKNYVGLSKLREDWGPSAVRWDKERGLREKRLSEEREAKRGGQAEAISRHEMEYEQWLEEEAETRMRNMKDQERASRGCEGRVLRRRTPSPDSLRQGHRGRRSDEEWNGPPPPGFYDGPPPPEHDFHLRMEMEERARMEEEMIYRDMEMRNRMEEGFAGPPHPGRGPHRGEYQRFVVPRR